MPRSLLSLLSYAAAYSKQGSTQRKRRATRERTLISTAHVVDVEESEVEGGCSSSHARSTAGFSEATLLALQPCLVLVLSTSSSTCSRLPCLPRRPRPRLRPRRARPRLRLRRLPRPRPSALPHLRALVVSLVFLVPALQTCLVFVLASSCSRRARPWRTARPRTTASSRRAPTGTRASPLRTSTTGSTPTPPTPTSSAPTYLTLTARA